jgi:hypothetical protein
VEILEMKTSINELKIIVEIITKTLDQVEGRRLGLEDKVLELLHSDSNKEQK